MKITKAQRHALEELTYRDISNASRVIVGVRPKTLDALVELGLARYCPYGKPPAWKIRKAGLDVLAGKEA